MSARRARRELINQSYLLYMKKESYVRIQRRRGPSDIVKDVSYTDSATTSALHNPGPSKCFQPRDIPAPAVLLGTQD